MSVSDWYSVFFCWNTWEVSCYVCVWNNEYCFGFVLRRRRIYVVVLKKIISFQYDVFFLNLFIPWHESLIEWYVAKENVSEVNEICPLMRSILSFLFCFLFFLSCHLSQYYRMLLKFKNKEKLGHWEAPPILPFNICFFFLFIYLLFKIYFS